MRLAGWRHHALVIPAVSPSLPPNTEAVVVTVYADGAAVVDYRDGLKPGEVLSTLHEMSQALIHREALTS